MSNSAEARDKFSFSFVNPLRVKPSTSSSVLKNVLGSREGRSNIKKYSPIASQSDDLKWCT